MYEVSVSSQGMYRIPRIINIADKMEKRQAMRLAEIKEGVNALALENPNVIICGGLPMPVHADAISANRLMKDTYSSKDFCAINTNIASGSYQNKINRIFETMTKVLKRK